MAETGSGIEMTTKITCFACSTISECKECGQEVEKEGITYDILDYPEDVQWESTLHGSCPECGSLRTEQ